MTVGMRELKNRAAEILRDVEERGAPMVVTRRGRPSVLILPIDCAEAEDYVLAHAPAIVASLREAESDLRTGKTLSLREYRRSRGL
jgi:prevent-host-death family protein